MLSRRPFETQYVVAERQVANREIVCVVKPNRFSPYQRISEVGLAGGWRQTVAQVISQMTNPYIWDRYFVRGPLGPVEVHPVSEFGKQPYLQTYANGLPTDNLLYLPECP
jgi:uncharacterized protein DUF3892